MAYYKPEELENVRKGLEWAKKNPTDPKSIEIQNRLKSGQLNFELRALGLKEVPVKVPKIVMPEMPQAEAPMSTVQPQKPTLGQEIKDASGDVLQTAQSIGATISEGAQNIQDLAGNKDLNLAQKSMGILGSLIGTGAKTIGDVTMGVGKVALTQDAEDQLKSFVEEQAGKIAETDAAKWVADFYGNLSPENKLIVDSAGGFLALVSELAGGGVAGKVATPIKEGIETAIDTGVDVTKRGIDQTSDTVSDLFKTSQKSLENKVKSSFEKGVKPNLQGYKTLGEAEKYRESIVEGAKVITKNKNSLQFLDDAGQPITGRTPESLQEFTEAIDQTKKKIYEQYDNLATQAGEQGVKIDTIKIANELDQVINNQGLKLSNPEAVKYATEVRDRFIRAGQLDAKTAQEVIQNYNASLKAFYKNPTPEGLTRQAVDALMANQMRQALDDGIEGLTGAQYQSLKSQYAALKTIERDVLRATLRDARKNDKGLIDYTDILSGGQLASGLITMNPGMIATGAAQKGMAEWFKYLNNPNRAIRQMFETGAKLEQEPGSVPIPTRKQLNAPEEGAPEQSVYTPMNLPERSQSTVDITERANPSIKQPTPTKGGLEVKDAGGNEGTIPVQQKVYEPYTPESELPVIQMEAVKKVFNNNKDVIGAMALLGAYYGMNEDGSLVPIVAIGAMSPVVRKTAIKEIKSAIKKWQDVAIDSSLPKSQRMAAQKNVNYLKKQLADASFKEGEIPTTKGDSTSSITKAKAEGKTFEEWANKQNPIYHGTPNTFEKFDPELTPGGSAWFSDNLDAVKNNRVEGSRPAGSKWNVMERYIKPGIKILDRNTPEGKKMADTLYSEQLESMGYRGIKHEADAERGSYIELFKPNEDTLTRSQLKAEWDKVGGVADDLTSSIKKAKSSGQSFDEWVKGQPTLYHGGTKDIQEIKMGKSNFQKTFYMSDNPDYAKSYGGNKSSLNEIAIDTKANLADLRKPSNDLINQIKNKIEPKPTGKTVKITRPDGSILELPETKGGKSSGIYSTTQIIQGIKDGKAMFAELQEVKQALKELGYDGLITQESKFGANYGVWNKDVLKTRSQLKAEWDKVK